MLGLQRVTKDLNGSSFDCGNARIQEQIRDSYLATLLREGYAYEITFKKEHAERKEVLGYCMVKLVTLRESQLPPEELDYYSTVYAGRPMEYAAVELTYLAIDKDLQGLGLGTAVLKLLIHRVMEVSDVIPIRYLVLNALKAKELRNATPMVHNCAQTIMEVYADDLGINKELANHLGCNFGGGMKCGSVCGAITSGLMILGAKGIDSPAKVNQFIKTISNNHHGLINCADLLKENAKNGGQKKPHCDGMIQEVIELIDQMEKEND